MRTYLPTPRARRAGKRALATFQKLESRELFAVISVTSFGAVPNDGGNDRAAIQAAISASQNGDTILFDGGVFDVSGFSSADGFIIPGDRTLRGDNGGTIKGKASNGQVITTHSSNVTFYGLGFDGGGVFLDKSGGGMNQGIVFDFCTFRQDVATGSNRNSITFTSGLQTSQVTNCYFTGHSGFAMYGYNYNTLTIANNELIDIQAGFHIDAFGNSGNLLVEQNYIKGAQGMGMEFQSTANNLVFQDNWYEHPDLSTKFSDNNNSFAYSLILDKSSNIQIRRNVVIAPERPDGVGCRIGFEVGGDNTTVEDNYINGVNHVLAVNDGVGTASVVAKNNKWSNYLQNASISFPSTNPLRTLTLSNNGPNTRLSDVMEARIAGNLKPGIGVKRYDGTGTPGPGPVPDPPPTTPTSPSGLSAINVGTSRIDLAWIDNSENETGFTVQMLADDGITWIALTTLDTNTTTYTMTGIAAGRSYSFRVTAFGAAGYSESSNTYTILTPIAETSSTSSSSSRKSRTVSTYSGSTDTSVSPPLTPSA
jgi:hypothetical protein